MNKKRVLWILCMAALSLMLVTVVRSRLDNRTDVIFGGAEGAYVRSDSVSFADPKGIETPEPTEDIWPKINIELPQYYLVNDAHPIASPRYAPEDISVIEGTGYMMFDTATKPYLEAMLQDMRDHGFSVYVAGAYRDYTYQKYLFDGKASQIALGMGLEGDEIWLDPRYQEAVAEARTITMFPGTSEHQLGLAVDLMDKPYSKMVYENMNQEFFKYLDSICAKYGFIKRYPTRKLLLTGWDEPWHYRYVGVEAATFIMEQGLCYEEFYAHYVPDFEY